MVWIDGGDDEAALACFEEACTVDGANACAHFCKTIALVKVGTRSVQCCAAGGGCPRTLIISNTIALVKVRFQERGSVLCRGGGGVCLLCGRDGEVSIYLRYLS